MALVDGSRIKGGSAYRQHQSLKDYVRQRDNHTCQICGAPGDIIEVIGNIHENPELLEKDRCQSQQ